MRLREADGVLGKQDAYPFDPRKLKIKPGYNVRDLDSEDERPALDELKASIKERGVEEPLKVQVEGEDVFIIRGHRRHRAAMELIAEGHEVPNVLVIQMARGMNDADLNLDIIAGNENRRDLTQLQIAEVIRRQHVVYKWDVDKIAKGIGKTRATIEGYLRKVELPEVVKQQVADGDISATEAVKVVRNLPAGTDPKVAAQLIAANKEENKRLGVGAKRQHKVTAKTLKRDNPKPKVKASTTETPAEQPAPASGLPATPTTEPQATFVAEVEEQPEKTLTAEEKVEWHAAIEGAKANQAPGPSMADVQAQIEKIVTAPAPVHPQLQDSAARETPMAIPQARNRIDALLLGFIAASIGELAAQYSRLCREMEETKAETGDTMQGQERLCVAADVIGALRFPDQWEGVKANSETLEQVA